MNKKAGLHEFVEGMEMTVLSSEDQVLLDGMVGTSYVTIVNTVPQCGCTNTSTQCSCTLNP